MEKKALIAIGLSIFVLLLFRYFEERRAGDRVRRNPPTAKPAPVTPPAEAPTAEVTPKTEKAAQPIVLQPQDTVASEHQVVIDGPLYRAMLDNRGGVLTSWKLKKHKDDQG